MGVGSDLSLLGNARFFLFVVDEKILRSPNREVCAKKGYKLKPVSFFGDPPEILELKRAVKSYFKVEFNLSHAKSNPSDLRSSSRGERQKSVQDLVLFPFLVIHRRLELRTLD